MFQHFFSRKKLKIIWTLIHSPVFLLIYSKNAVFFSVNVLTNRKGDYSFEIFEMKLSIDVSSRFRPLDKSCRFTLKCKAILLILLFYQQYNPLSKWSVFYKLLTGLLNIYTLVALACLFFAFFVFFCSVWVDRRTYFIVFSMSLWINNNSSLEWAPQIMIRFSLGKQCIGSLNLDHHIHI